MSEKITFDAVVYKVQTLVDGGIRVTLDLPETATLQMAQLAECHRFGVVLEVTVNKFNNKGTNGKSELGKRRPKSKSEWKAEEEAGINTGA